MSRTEEVVQGKIDKGLSKEDTAKEVEEAG